MQTLAAPEIIPRESGQRDSSEAETQTIWYLEGEKLSMHYDAMFDVGLDTDEEEVIWMRKSDMEHPDGIHELNLAEDIILFR